MMTAGATTSCGAIDHSISSRSPFTPTQWQELEHQALIFKYMVSGVPIPPELIYSVKRSLDSSLMASRLFPTQHVGWGCFQVGFGRKADPEPGRCRRTDGKKWRCSKEAYPDSKYCERHMHRGKNRSRKPVEALTSSSASAISSLSLSSSSTSTNPSSISSLNRKLTIDTPSSSITSSSSTYSFSSLSSPISPELYAHQETSHLNPFLYPYSSSASRHPGSSGLSTHDNTTTHHLFLDSGSCSQIDKDYSIYNFRGTREDAVDERAFFPQRTFFPETSGSLRNFQALYSPYDKTYSHHSHLQSFSDSSKVSKQQGQQHCFILDTDFKSSAATVRSVKIEKEDETQKPLHHFFGEWLPKNTDS